MKRPPKALLLSSFCLLVLAVSLSPAAPAGAQEVAAETAVGPAAEQAPQGAAPAPRPQAPQTVPFGRDQRGGGAALAAMVTEQGPLFALAPIVARLGGELRVGPAGEGRLLVLEEREMIFGPESPVLLVDGEPVRLSQPPMEVPERGLLVPLDLLRATYGELLGYRFAWEEQGGVLRMDRRSGQELAVTVDVVNVQGLTTVVLQFPEAPRYRIADVVGGVEVRLLGDRLEPSAWRFRERDPLVRDVRLAGDRVVLDLAPGTGYDSYTLEAPFRLVFDVHPERRAAAPGVPAGEPPHDSPGVRTIVIDPGHGGSESGAVGPSGTEEKELSLLLAYALKSRLERRLPVRVILTRLEDANLPLETRTAIANQNKADLFISLHLNSEYGRGARGAETYFLSLQASDERAARSAEIENAAADGEVAVPQPETGAGDPLYDLQLILWDLAQSRHLAESQKLASLIQEELNGALGLRDRGVKQAPFRVLMGAAMPAVLVELGFISNPDEEERLRDAGYRAELVEAVSRAVERFKAQVDGGAERRAATVERSGESGR